MNQRALVMGFTKSNDITFIDTALKGSHSKINHFKDQLHSNPLIDNLCNIPLIMTMLLWFVVNDEEIAIQFTKNSSKFDSKVYATGFAKTVPNHTRTEIQFIA